MQNPLTLSLSVSLSLSLSLSLCVYVCVAIWVCLPKPIIKVSKASLLFLQPFLRLKLAPALLFQGLSIFS